MVRVIGFGDNVVDFYRHTNTMYPGGNALNFAVFSRLLGCEAAYLGVFGDDACAQHVYETLRALDIPMDHCRFYPGENGCAQVRIEDGERVFLGSNRGGISKEHPWSLTALDLAYLRKFDLIHTSIFSYTDAVLPELKRSGLRVSYDFSDYFEEEMLQRICPHLWCACLSGAGLSLAQCKARMREIAETGCEMVLLTRGAQGALLYAQEKFYAQSPCLVQAVDTMAAGDAFQTAFLTAYLQNERLGRDFAPCREPQGLCSRQAYLDALIMTALHQAAVFSAENCRRDGSFGFGKKA